MFQAAPDQYLAVKSVVKFVKTLEEELDFVAGLISRYEKSEELTQGSPPDWNQPLFMPSFSDSQMQSYRRLNTQCDNYFRDSRIAVFLPRVREEVLGKLSNLILYSQEMILDLQFTLESIVEFCCRSFVDHAKTLIDWLRQCAKILEKLTIDKSTVSQGRELQFAINGQNDVIAKMESVWHDVRVSGPQVLFRQESPDILFASLDARRSRDAIQTLWFSYIRQIEESELDKIRIDLKGSVVQKEMFEILVEAREQGKEVVRSDLESACYISLDDPIQVKNTVGKQLGGLINTLKSRENCPFRVHNEDGRSTRGAEPRVRLMHVFELEMEASKDLISQLEKRYGRSSHNTLRAEPGGPFDVLTHSSH